MKVLVTGHLGYIGPILLGQLAARGHETVGLDVGYFRECIDDGDAATPPGREIVRDIRDVRAEDLDGIDAIAHLAALSNDPMGQIDPTLTEDINYASSVRLAELARDAGVERFVMASSCSIYGATAGNDTPLTEQAEWSPVSAYAVSKVRTEQALTAMAGDDFSPVFMRNATAYGVSPRMRFDLVVANLMAWARTTGVVRVMSDGTPWRPLVHIADISQAVCVALEAERDTVHNQAFNIGRDDANYQVRDIAAAVAERVPGAEIEITGESGGDPRSYRVDFGKVRSVLPEFTPTWTLERGCDELVEWFDRREGHTIETNQSRRYVRLKQLTHLMDTDRVDDRLRPSDGSL